MQRSHHRYPRHHRIAATLPDQHQHRHRGLPFRGVVFGLGEFGDVERGVAERDQRLAPRQFDRIEKSLVPRQAQLHCIGVSSARAIPLSYIREFGIYAAGTFRITGEADESKQPMFNLATVNCELFARPRLFLIFNEGTSKRRPHRDRGVH